MITALRLALRALLAARTRTWLTVLGILIGTSAVVVVVALGSGARERILAEIDNMGSAVIFVFPESRSHSGARVASNALTEDDRDAIRLSAPSVQAITAWSSIRTRVHSAYDSYRTVVMGIDESHFDVRGFSIRSGRSFTPEEFRNKAKVAVIGQTTRLELFGAHDPVGQTVRIGQHTYQIIGLLAEKGRSSFEDQDDRIMLPIESYRARVSVTSGRRVQILVASARSPAHTAQAEAQIRAILRERHRLRPGDFDDFAIRTQEAFRKNQEEILDLVTTLLLSVALVALFTGGVGVMNIMLISVAERTREIGIRLSIGAREGDILLQFLFEALLLTLTGGALGILLAVVVTIVMRSTLGWAMSIDINAVIAAVATSTGAGLLFGILPARRAARLDPVDALRKG